MKRGKIAQAAVEFLTSYGWAILILVIIIVAIIGLGVFNPKAPNKCNSVDPIYCSDVRLTSSTNPTPNIITLALSASGTSTKPGQETKITEIELDSPTSPPCTSFSPTDIIPTNEQKAISCTLTGSLSKNQRFSGKATIIYFLQEAQSASLDHTAKISFSGEIE